MIRWINGDSWIHTQTYFVGRRTGIDDDDAEYDDYDGKYTKL